jgi:hypothetical protein
MSAHTPGLLPCLCGNPAPFVHVGPSAVRIACNRCGLELADSCVRTYWTDGDAPLALERFTYQGDGWPEKSRFVSVTAPLALYGHTERWNRLMRVAAGSAS